MPRRAPSLENDPGNIASDVMNVAFIAGALAQPVAKVVAVLAPVPGMDLALSLVEKIFAVMEQMRYNKKQCRRLAESARDVVEAVEEALTGVTPEEIDTNMTANVDKLVRTLKRTVDHLREIAALNFVKRLLQYASIQDELVELDREIQDATAHFMIKFAIDSKRHQMQNEKARRDDQKAMLDELRRVVKDQDELAQRIGLRGGKLDSDSQNAIQVILHRIDHEPDRVPEEVRAFAEEATKTIKTRTNFDVPRTLPWFVKTREIKRGVKIGSGGFSVVYKGFWLTRDMDVAVKVFREQNGVNELLDEVFIWRSFSHPNLHPFLGAAPFEQPAFVVSPFCINGNALEYLENTPKADRLQILHDISRGMEYLHAQNVVHGDLKARNVLIDDDGRALVADFGLAKFERVSIKPAATQSPSEPNSTPTKTKMVNIVGTLHWLAPECFVEGGVTKASDMWAMGMCAYELFTNGRIPLVEIASDDLGQRLLDGARPNRVDTIPDSAWTTMERCWAHEPLTRPTFSQLCLVLGVFQDSDIESLHQASEGFAGEHWSGSELSRWPGLAERLIGILTSVLKIGPVQSVSESATNTLFSLSPQSQGRVVSALRVLVTLARSSGEDVSVGQIIVDAGALPALLFILQERSNVDAEILRLGCEILDGLSEGYANETLASIASSDFISALIKLAGGAEIQTARKALDTAGKLVVSKRTFEEESEKKQRVITLGIIPRLLDVFGRKDATDAIIEACNFSCMLALPPVALSVEHVKDIIRALVPLILHTYPPVRLAVMKTVKIVLYCRDEESKKVIRDGDSGELANAVLDLTEQINNETHIILIQGALDVLSAISTISSVPRLVVLLRSAEETDATPRKKANWPRHTIYSILLYPC
ncbi:kinase-like domain-containing protein [Mycena vulgaris]|nr:kinase-like domain-containing protein [Mycena vulgaris]